MDKGCPIMFSDPPVTEVYEDTDQCLRQRCMKDSLYLQQLEDTVRKNHPEALGDDPFDLDFVDFMCRTGIRRNSEPLWLPMGKKARARMVAGVTYLHSEQPDARNTAPLRQHDDFSALREQSRTHSSSSQGKGKSKGKSQGKGQGKGKWEDRRWQRDNQWQNEWRCYNWW